MTARYGKIKTASAEMRDLQMDFMRRNYAKAKDNPKACARAMKRRGMWSGKVNVRTIETAVRKALIQIESEILKEKLKPKQEGFFPEEEITKKRINEKYTPEEKDKYLDDLFSGKEPYRIGLENERSPKGGERHFQELLYNEKGAAEKYVPYRRISRRGKDLTSLEKRFIKEHQSRGVNPDVTARILQRKVDEFFTDYKGLQEHARLKQAAPTVDLLLAYRYQYYCVRDPIISDTAYDAIKKEELEFGGAESLLLQPASDKVLDYPPHIRNLAAYLQFKHWVNLGEPESKEAKMPYGMIEEHKERKKKKK